MTKLFTVLLILIFSQSSLVAQSLQSLQSQQRLQVLTRISEDKVFAPNEQVILEIEVVTDRWFSQGTRIALPEIKNAIVLQRSSTAVNSSQRKGGETWVHQLWKIVIYPHSSGQYSVPPISVAIGVAGEDGKAISGNVLTQAVSFEVKLPKAQLNENNDWLVGRNYKLLQKLSVEGEQQLKVGDVIELKLEQQATDTSAMLLPDLAKSSQLLGGKHKRYAANPELIDKQNRGDYSGSRNDNISWIIQEPGEYTLAKRSVWWWDPKAQALKEIILEAQSWQVKHTPASFFKQWALQIVLALVLLVALVYLALKLRKRWQQPNAPLAVQWFRANRDMDLSQLSLLLYRRLWTKQSKIELSKTQTNDNNWPKQLQTWNQQFTSEPKKLSKLQWHSLYQAIKSSAKAKQHSWFVRFRAIPDLEVNDNKSEAILSKTQKDSSSNS